MTSTAQATVDTQTLSEKLMSIGKSILSKWLVISSVFGGLGLLFLVSWISNDQASKNPAHPSPEVAFAIITGGALVIERTLEMLWTLVDMTFGTWWPFGQVNKQIKDRIKSFDEFAKPYFDGIEAASKTLGDKDAIKTKITAALNEIPTIKKDVARLTNNEQLNKLAGEVSNRLNAILAAHPDLKTNLPKDVDLAEDLGSAAKDFLADFKDNPIRRVISIYLGAMAGILIATVAGVEIFGATDTLDQTTKEPMLRFRDWAVPLTGVIMGLGANPTHEIVAALKAYKQKSNTT